MLAAVIRGPAAHPWQPVARHHESHMHVVTTPLPNLPLVGRTAELDMLHALLDEVAQKRGRTLILAGESGVGKSRLVRETADEASRRGFQVALGRAYPVETGVPYAPLADAMLPLLGALSGDSLAVLTRGGEAELLHLFPALRPAAAPTRTDVTDAAEFKSRLLWNFSQLLCRLAAKQPLLLAVEDLQWADASSLELLHFVARQTSTERIALLCSYNETQRDQNPTLRQVEQSLTALKAASVHRLEPLSSAETSQLVRETFGVEEAVVRGFTDLLFGWTRGNPFFLEQMLKSLVQSGRLQRRDGTWEGWDLEELQLPRSIRDVVLERADRLSTQARALAELHAIIGTSAGYDTLRAVSPLAEEAFVAALDELRRGHIIAERVEGDELVYDFSHPVLRDTLHNELGKARTRLLHGAVAEALETLYAGAAIEHADELAFHYARAGARHLAPKAMRYLAAAGERALAQHAYREAADYLNAALELADQSEAPGEAADRLIDDLARARQRLGDFGGAIALWQRALQQAEHEGEAARVATIQRRLGLAYHWSGRIPDALAHYDAGLDAAGTDGNELVRARLKLAKGECLQDIGRPQEAERVIRDALQLAERKGDLDLQARIHRALLLLHTWTGPPDRAREHGQRALELAARTRDLGDDCAAHWGMAVLEGLTGDGAATARHIRECERLADELRSPLHRLWIAEVSIEYLAATGDWDEAIALGERAIRQARILNQRSLLPRLLVWTALIYFGRDDIERGKQYVDEAWELSGAGTATAGGAVDLHSVIPAHTGRVAYHVAVGEYPEAIEIGEAGLAIADRSGYAAWAIHRLLPRVGEACLFMADAAGAAHYGQRLRRESERMGQKLGHAWADACDAFLTWMRGDLDQSLAMLLRAAERLEEIPNLPDASRLRRQYAARLRDAGRRDEALRELRRIHEIFARLGFERELQKTREQIRELGARPPAREPSAVGAAGLTAREVEIVRLVLNHRSNKAIGAALDISPRTVSTHLSNIFQKLNVSSRLELAELARTLRLPQ